MKIAAQNMVSAHPPILIVVAALLFVSENGLDVGNEKVGDVEIVGNDEVALAFVSSVGKKDCTSAGKRVVGPLVVGATDGTFVGLLLLVVTVDPSTGARVCPLVGNWVGCSLKVGAAVGSSAPGASVGDGGGAPTTNTRTSTTLVPKPG